MSMLKREYLNGNLRYKIDRLEELSKDIAQDIDKIIEKRIIHYQDQSKKIQRTTEGLRYADKTKKFQTFFNKLKSLEI